MSTVKIQAAFTRAVARLIDKATEMGYDVTLGDAYRDPRLHGAHGKPGGYGSANSYHKLRLAIDLNLFKDGAWLARTEDHAALGQWWMDTYPEACWGGTFNDGNHYSWGECRGR